MQYHDAKKEASNIIEDWLGKQKEERAEWSVLQKALLLKYGLGRTITNKLKEELQ